jgi:hypothetical protein
MRIVSTVWVCETSRKRVCVAFNLSTVVDQNLDIRDADIYMCVLKLFNSKKQRWSNVFKTLLGNKHLKLVVRSGTLKTPQIALAGISQTAEDFSRAAQYGWQTSGFRVEKIA